MEGTRPSSGPVVGMGVLAVDKRRVSFGLYRVLAYVTGVFLIGLTFIAMPAKYLVGETSMFALAPAPEGLERWFGPEQTLRVDTSAVRSPMQSLQYCNLRAKDGICDRLRDLEGARPSIDTVRPDAKVHLFLDETSATFYLDTSGESLFKRGWRHDKGDAPLRENLAAGLWPCLAGTPASL